MQDRFASVNGHIVPLEKAAVSIQDRGLLYGDGLFETMRMQAGSIVRLPRHMQRLMQGAQTLGFADALSQIDLSVALISTCEANELSDARIRLTVTRGPSDGPGKLEPPGTVEPTAIITADPLPMHEPSPARVTISAIRRDETNPLSGVKSLNYLPGILARAQAVREGYDDAILLNTQGAVAEGTVGNLFLVKGNRLITPSLDQGPLPGTVRAAVMLLAAGLGLEVEERAVSPAELEDADELFFTNAIQLVRPVCAVGGCIVGVGGSDVSTALLTALRRQ